MAGLLLTLMAGSFVLGVISFCIRKKWPQASFIITDSALIVSWIVFLIFLHPLIHEIAKATAQSIGR